MSTTTIRLPEDLKARVAAAAKRAGTSTHGFILEAIAEKTAQEGQRADLMRLPRSAMPVSPPPGRRFRGRKCAVIWKSVSPAKSKAPGSPQTGALRCRASNWHRRWGMILIASSITLPNIRLKIRCCASGDHRGAKRAGAQSHDWSPRE